MEGWEGVLAKGHQEGGEGEGYVRCIEGDDGFTGVYICHIKKCTL